MKISIVTTLYQSEPYIEEFYQRSLASVQKITQDYEFIFVDDASPDGSLQKVRQLQQTDSNVTLIELSRNFGQHKAMMTGLSYTTGELVFMLDSDLEEPPEMAELFYQKMKEKECDVVYGIQKKRKGGWFEKLSGFLFFKLINFITDLHLSPSFITGRLMRRCYVQNLVQFKESSVFIGGLWQITGFHQEPCFVNKTSKGSTSYTLAKKISILVNAITSFSIKPLHYIFYFGAFISCLSFLYVIYLVIMKLFFSHPLAGWPSLMASIWFLGGVMILFVGVIGIYLSRIFIETKGRPYTIIKKVYSENEENA